MGGLVDWVLFLTFFVSFFFFFFFFGGWRGGRLVVRDVLAGQGSLMCWLVKVLL